MQTGRRGEELAAAWYRDHGYDIVDRNWRTTFGEIDLVARRRSLVVVSEVKTRRSEAFGSPAHAVGWTKQQRLRRLAAAWLTARRPPGRCELRFDVVAVIAAGDRVEIEVYEDAF
jgi:putative endonuclease